MGEYVQWVRLHPILSASLQFAALGTLGEVIAACMVRKKLALPCTVTQLAAKMLAWALLGVIIKYGFAGMKGFTQALLDYRMADGTAFPLLPAFLAHGVGKAFAISVLTNLFFGPQMMFFHRLEDNLILRVWSFEGLKTAWWTLIWFWIPAHTVTFSLPTEYQIGLAALWGLVLGVILGMAKGRAMPKPLAA